MKKKFIAKYKKRRRHKKIKYALLTILLLGSFVFSIYYCNKIAVPLTNEEFLRILLSESNHHLDHPYSKHSIMTKVVKFLSNVNFDNPATILNQNYLGLTTTNEEVDQDENLEDLEEMSQYVNDPYPDKEVKEPKVYIYNTHQLENYTASNLAEYNVQPNVMMGSYILREKLNDLGIPSMVEEGNVNDILQMNNWNYAASYEVTKMFMLDAIEKNPSLEYFIDFHRDSVSRDITHQTIDDKNYARVLFIVGMENPTYEANLKITTEINNLIDEQYPGLSRGIYKKEGPGVNGVYNQDVSPNTILIEVGGVDNTIEEVLNTTEVFADIFHQYLEGKK